MRHSLHGKKRKSRQTQLSFTPVAPSSSPTAERSPRSHRAAHVRYLNSSSSPLPKRPRTPLFVSTKANGSSHNNEVNYTASPLSSSSSSDEESIRAPQSSSRRGMRKRAISQVDLGVSETRSGSSSDSDDIVASSPTKRRRRNVAIETPRSPPNNGIVTGQDEPDSDDIVRSSPLRRKKRGLKRLNHWGGNNDEDKNEILNGRANRAQRDKVELQEDLDDLCDSAVMKGRTRGGPAVSASKMKRQQQLEALKRRRAGGKLVPMSHIDAPHKPSESESEADSDSDTTSEVDSGASSSSSSDEQPVQKDSDVESEVTEDLDKYEDDFVLQDDDAELGAPAELAEIPFEFTRHRYKRLKDHFKDVVEWMVHNKANPAFRRTDAVYQAAFLKVEDEVKGVAGSQLLSSVWNVDFRRALEARPDIVVTTYPISEGHPCDACNRSKHPASFDIRFDGNPYLLETLEPVEDSSDDDRSELNRRENVTIDSQGNEVPNENTHFYLGRHCKAKATMAHTLLHWRYQLNEWIIDYLCGKGVFDDNEIIKREHWSQNRRTKYANGLVDKMEEAGEINRLWKDFNLNLKTARSASTSRW